MQTIAIYPGSFDPITKGHADLVKRSLSLFDKVIVAVSINHSKEPLFTFEERAELTRIVLSPFGSNIQVISFKGLLVDVAGQYGATGIIRGLRAVSDFDYEFQLAAMNRNLAPNIETIFLTPSEKYSFLSSSMIKEVASLGGDISKFVSPEVEKALVDKLRVNF
ncbi:MAG: pantetheine-phosphate adenylyltransferase [Gammaproteobacteria bacterium]|nr:pantetheine-phosphate adenylyltransferase [Gammaproteobacteria bacterium]